MPILRASHPTEGLREASWAGWDCGLRVPDRCGSIRRGGADFVRAQQAGPLLRRNPERSGTPRYPCAEPGSARSSLFDTIDIDSTSARSRRLRNAARLRESLGCPSPKPRRLRPDGAFGALLQPDRHALAGPGRIDDRYPHEALAGRLPGGFAAALRAGDRRAVDQPGIGRGAAGRLEVE